MLFAHREVYEDGTILVQSLEEHLYSVGTRAGQLGQEIHMKSFMRLAGYLHDVGKGDRLFQHYIIGTSKRSVNHSSAGGRVFAELIYQDYKMNEFQKERSFQYFQEVMTYIIFAHHGLFDSFNEGTMQCKAYEKLQYDAEGDYHFREDVLPFVYNFDNQLQQKGEQSLTELLEAGYEEFKQIYNRIVILAKNNKVKKKQQEEKENYFACFTRLCLSILKEADIYDSANAFLNPKQKLWEENEKIQVWEEASARIEEMYQAYEGSPKQSELNTTRNVLAKAVWEAAQVNEAGVYKLELPTGAGKTKAGIRYGVTNAKIHRKSRIFYVTAFLSVLEQNASEIKHIIEMDEVVIEHHSNVIIDDDIGGEGEDIEEYKTVSYLRESWESPIILTTMVQFFHTLFKEKSSNIRRFCKLINSVIILDEVQSLPLKVLSNFNLMMNFMKDFMNCNIVHCTATQPVLESEAMNYRLYYGDVTHQNDDLIAGFNLKEMDCFKRVNFYNLTGSDALHVLSKEDLFERIEQEFKVFDSCLIILNKKSTVFELYEYLLENMDADIIYLTTNLCPAHRLNIISDMKEKLLANRQGQAHRKLVCVSTQLIEAGVDVDFDAVFRALSGIDSLVQSAGRCNREGKLNIDGKPIRGKVYIFRYKNENLSNLPDIKATVDAAEYAIRREQLNKADHTRLEVSNLQKNYFEKYYISNNIMLDYIDRKRQSNMVEELGGNPQGRGYFKVKYPNAEKPKLFQAFRTAAENFHLIDQDTIGVIVPYQNVELIETLYEAVEERNYSVVNKLLQQLQRYTVNLYLTPNAQRFISKREDLNVYFLQKEYYNVNTGINLKDLADLII